MQERNSIVSIVLNWSFNSASRIRRLCAAVIPMICWSRGLSSGPPAERSSKRCTSKCEVPSFPCPGTSFSHRPEPSSAPWMIRMKLLCGEAAIISNSRTKLAWAAGIISTCAAVSGIGGRKLNCRNHALIRLSKTGPSPTAMTCAGAAMTHLPRRYYVHGCYEQCGIPRTHRTTQHPARRATPGPRG